MATIGADGTTQDTWTFHVCARARCTHPSVKVVHVFSKFNRQTLEFMAEAVRDGKLVIPISQKLPLSEAAEAQATAERGVAGKILLVA